MDHSIHALLLLMLTQWSVRTLINFSNIFWLRYIFDFSEFNFSTMDISNFIFHFHLQWSFNAMGHSIHSLLLLMLTRWSNLTLTIFSNIFDFDIFWFSDFNFSMLEISNFIFDFHLQWSINAMDHSIHALLILMLTRCSVLTLMIFQTFFDSVFFDFLTSTFRLWKFQISVFNFIFNDHSMQWIIQYIQYCY